MVSEIVAAALFGSLAGFLAGLLFPVIVGRRRRLEGRERKLRAFDEQICDVIEGPLEPEGVQLQLLAEIAASLHSLERRWP